MRERLPFSGDTTFRVVNVTLIRFALTSIAPAGLTGLVGAMLLGGATVVAAAWLHAGLTANVLRSPGIFFDVTPTGRILSRFSKDVETIDSTLPTNIGSFLYCAFRVVGTVCVVGYSTPMTLLVFFLLGVLYFLTQVDPRVWCSGEALFAALFVWFIAFILLTVRCFAQMEHPLLVLPSLNHSLV